MTAPRVPPAVRWFVVLMVLATGLRVWAGMAFPVLDLSDKGQLWAGLGMGLVMAFVARYSTRDLERRTASTNRFLVPMVVGLLGFVLGVLLGSGSFLAGNALLDRAPVTWTAFTVEGHPRGRNGSRLELREYRADGSVHEVWIPDTRGTVNFSIGEKVEVPIRPGAFGSAWMDGELRRAP